MNMNLLIFSPFRETAVRRSVLFSVKFPHRFKSETVLNFYVMKFFKSDEQEIKFYIIGIIIFLAIYIILSMLRELQ